MPAARLAQIHRRAVENFRSGCRCAGDILPADDREFLASQGIRAQVAYDYAEDFVKYAEPTCEEFLRVVEIRRRYFLGPMGGSIPAAVPEPDLPRKTDELGGIPWLARILVKARCFLEGSLCEDVMYGCSGDRAFLKQHSLTLPGFLEIVRDAPAVLAAPLRASGAPADDQPGVRIPDSQ
jgi:hypothetical protein